MKISNLEDFAREFKILLDRKPELEQIIGDGSKMLGELVGGTEWFRPALTRLALDQAFLASQWQSIDPNDIQIYLSPDRDFSIRAYIWEPDVIYPIHDHGSWGLVGAFINQIQETKYERVDNGADADYAKIKVLSRAVLQPGETTFVLPENKGIHQMHTVGSTAVTIHVYGRAVRKGYINYFYPNNKVSRVYSPSVVKKVLAIKTLGSIDEPWAKEVLTRTIEADNPEYIKNECRCSLDKLED
jgi:predicted metal-dependent enzyme (double-stranded beta helix superfamily)